ncbi:MAG: Gfo/Idh/MocA family oxidoreductase [Gemmatimonadaceae bacterium]
MKDTTAGGSEVLTRRDFLATGAAAAVAIGMPSVGSSIIAPPRSVRRRYAIIGTGGRGSTMWAANVLAAHGDAVELVGLCDVNRKRVAEVKRRLKFDGPIFTEFDAMCDQVKPDLLTITTVDATHAEYIVRALDRGIDVITEKPMVTDEEKCRAVLDAEKRNGRKITVGFNYRYSAKHQTIKKVLASGAIGKISSVDFAWYLDISHGADYFRRWHRLRKNSGSLLVHKATHHFDLVNFWLDAAPVEVSAFGSLQHYGKNGPFRHTTCRGCPHAAQCPFFWDITKDADSMGLYVNCESEDGYTRDGCVFREDIDIFDTMNVVAKYDNGAQMSYSLNACMPFEGYRIAFNGTKGRLEVRDHERQPWKPEHETEIYLTKNFGQRTLVPVETPVGGHGGADPALLQRVFDRVRGKDVPDLPTSRDGALSCLTGIAARKSLDEKRLVRIDELVPGL